MKKALTLILVFMITASVFGVFANNAYGQVSMTTDLQVKSYTYYTSPATSDFVLVGEVQNVGSETFHDARVRALIYNASDVLVSESVYSRIYADQILPNGTAPFYMLFTSSSSITGDLSWVNNSIARVDFFCFGSANTTQNEPGLVVGGHNGALDSSGDYVVTGIVINRGTSYPERCYVVGSFYDSSGEVIAIGISEYLTPYLAPNDYAQFSFGLFDASPAASSQVASYTLHAIADGTLSTTPPTAVPSPTNEPTDSPNQTASPLDPSDSDNSAPPDTLYIVIAVVAIVIALIVLVLLLKRR